MNISLSAFAPENLASRDGLGSPAPRQPAHLRTQAESGAYLRDSSEFRGGVHLSILNRHTPSGQSRVYRVTQLRTDGDYCRESAGTGPVNLQGSSKRVLPWQVTMDKLICASLSHTHYYWYEMVYYIVSVLFLLFFWCPCMAIYVSVQYNGGLLPDIILLTQCYFHRGTTRLNAMKRVLCLQPLIPPKRFDIFSPLTGNAQKV